MSLRYLLCLFIFSSNLNGQSQDTLNSRSLRPLTEAQDTMEVRVRYAEDGAIQYLLQTYLSYQNGETYLHEEEYRKDKFWTLWQYKEVLKKERRRVSVYQPVAHGPQLQYTEQGQILYVDNYDLGEPNPVSLEWEYYPNGSLKYVAEIKDKRYWNFRTYYYPSGEAYNFGDFHNGQGMVIHLDNTGDPCLECQFVGKKVRGKLRCEEDGG